MTDAELRFLWFMVVLGAVGPIAAAILWRMIL